MDNTWIIVWTCVLLFSNSISAKYRGSPSFGSISGNEDFEDPSEVQRKAFAHLLVDKRVLNQYLVESMDMIVQFRIYNIGSQTATDVRLFDRSFDDRSKYMIVGGLTDAHFGRILGGTNVSHVIVVRPLQSGPILFEPAQITYQSGDNQEQVFFGSSSEPEKNIVYSTGAFHRKFSAHFEEWIVFAILSLPSLLIPYMLWFSNKSKYEDLIDETESESGVTRKRRMHCHRDC